MSSQDATKVLTVLSENLQLLHEMNYSDLDMPYQFAGSRSNKPTRREETHADIRALNITAVRLATGRPGDIITAAFDKNAGLHLILAKNGQPTTEDVAATKRFLAAVTSAKDWADVMPFVFQHGKANLIRQMSQLYQFLSAFHLHQGTGLA